MTVEPLGAQDFDRWPLDDEEVEVLLSGGRTDRDELASLERFLGELRAPRFAPRPQPSEELTRLFSGGADAAHFGSPSSQPRRVGSGGRKPVRRMVKVAVATTTAALAVTLAAAAQVLPNTQAKTSVAVSGPATPVPLEGDARIVTGASGAGAHLGAGVTVARPSTSATTRPATSGPVPEVDPATLSPDALGRLPLDVLKTLTGEVLARLPFDVLKTLPGDALARVPVDLLKTLPGDALARLPPDVLKTLPGDALARLPLDVLRTLPTDALLRLPADVLKTLPGDALARLPLDVLRALPIDVQSRLPVEVLRLLPLNVPSPTTTIAGRP